MRSLEKNIKKNSIIVINYLVNYSWFFLALGFFNKYLLKGKIKSVFLVYPAKRKYIIDFTFDWFSKKMKWTPFLIGFFIQKGKVGIIFSISAEEKDILDDNQRKNLKLAVDKMEEKRKLLKAEMKSFAGILPGVLSKKGILEKTKTKEVDSTVMAVFRAIEALGEEEKLPSNFPVIILGGKGFVGRGVMSFFEKQEPQKKSKREVCAIDLDNFSEVPEFLKKIGDKKVVFLNITKNKAINEYIPFFNSKTIVLNEVYPEPSTETLEKIKKKGANCYHIVGLKGAVYPPFPGAYSQGVPCCASFMSCGKNDIIIKKLI